MKSSNIFKSSEINPTLASSADVAVITKPLQKLGIGYFTFSRVYRSGKRIYLTNQPSVLETYFNGNHYLNGNTEGYPDIYSPQITLWETLPNQTVLDKVARAHNFNHGIFIIEPQDKYCDFIGIAAEKSNREIINTYLTNLDYLKDFTRYFKDKAANIIQAVSKHNLILPFNHDIIDFTNNYHCADLIDINNANMQVKFTARQYEIAQLLLHGKAIKDIAKELKLSPRTIETHVNLLKLKLKCHKLTELILKLSKIMVSS